MQACQLHKNREDFSRECLYNIEQYYDGQSSCMVYDLNPFDGHLVSLKPSDNLYLALLLKKQLDYDKAFKYLARVKIKSSLSSFDLSLIEQFLKDEDRSPASLAFNLKLLLFVVENVNQLDESRFGKKINNQFYSIFDWGIKAYIRYLNTINSETQSAIPMSLRLNVEEEKALLLTLELYKKQINESQDGKKSQINFQPLLPRILDKRFEVLATKENAAEFTIDPKEIPLTPPIFASIPLLREDRSEFLSSMKRYGTPFLFGPNAIRENSIGDETNYEVYPNRITPEAIAVNFEDLYEKARNCPSGNGHPFDFTLLALLKQNFNHWHQGPKLACLLFFTRHFSDQFQDLTFLNAKNDNEKMEIYDSICSRLKAISKTQRYHNFCATHLQAKGEFPYTKDISLPAIKSADRKPFLEIPNQKAPENLRHLRKAFFSKKSRDLGVEVHPPFLDPTLMEGMGPLEHEILNRILTGYEDLKTKKKVSYELGNKKLKKLKDNQDQFLKEKQSLSDRLAAQRKLIMQKLNAPYKLKNGKLTKQQMDAELSYLRAKDSRQTEPLSPEKIMKEVILKRDLSYLSKRAPLMTNEEMEELISDVKEYYHQLVLYRNFEEALVYLEKLVEDPNDKDTVQKLAEILDYAFDYDPHEYPEISYFKVDGGKLPRPEQISIYKWICEGLEKGENRMFQLAAGGGKTSYLIPLLMLRAKRMNLTPVVCTTQTIYNIDKENLKETLIPLQEKLGLLETGMHMKLTEDDLRLIYKELERYHIEGRGIIITPQACYALHLLYRVAAIKEKNPGKVKWLSLILHFFKTKSLFLVDEFHRNGDPLTRAIFGTGEFYFIPEKERELFISMMLPLLGIEELCTNDERKIPLSTLSRMKSNLLGMPSEEDIRIIQQSLAEHLVKSPLLNIPVEKRDEFIHYWTVKNQNPPEIMEQWHNGNDDEKERAGLTALTGYFLHDILKHITKMRTGLDHGVSIYPEEKFDTPYHHTSPTTSQYEDPYIAISATIKGNYHRYLSREDIRELIGKLINEFWKNYNFNQSNHLSTPSQRFKNWMRNAPSEELKNLDLVDIDLNNRHQMNPLIDFLSKNPETIKEYLKTEILTQIGKAKEQFSVTPSHIMNGKKLTFTATPLPEGACSRAIDAFHYENAFAAHVVYEYSKQKNQNYIFPESTETFFDEMKDNQAFKESRVFLDPGGFFSDWKNVNVAKKWMETSPDLDGVLFFKEGNSLKVDKEEKLSLRLRNGKIIEFEGSMIIEALAKENLDWHKLQLGTLYSAAQTESSNVLQKTGTKAFVFVGNLLTSSHLAQTLMRLRGFLSEEMNQSVTWIIQRDLAGKIKLGQSGKLDGSSLFFWSLKNEADHSIKQLILGAFQEIAFAIESIALDEIESALNDPEEQIRLFLKYQEGFIERPPLDPYEMFGKGVKDVDTGDVLMKYAKDLYLKFEFAGAPFSQQHELLQKIDSIIAETKPKVATIATNYEQTIGKEVEQHCKLKKETEQEELRPRPFDPLAAATISGSLKITDPGYPVLGHRIPARQSLNCQALTERLYFDISHVHTATNTGSDLGVGFLKPIDTFTIILRENREPFAIVNINEHTSSYIDQLKDCPDNLKLNHSAFIVSSQGVMIQYGKGSIAPAPEEVEKVLNSQWFVDLLIDAKLLKGEIPVEGRELDRLIARIGEWPKPGGFKEFFQRVAAAQPNPETVNLKMIFDFLDEKIGRNQY